MTFVARMSDTVGADWLRVESVSVGFVPSVAGTPDRYVTLADDDEPVLRVDIYPHQPDCFAFQEAIVWRDNLIAGLGSHVYAISIADHSAITIALDSYFGYLYPMHQYLLLASGERLFRMQPNRSILWKSAQLGIDGVVVHDAGPVIIRGEGEWDPPGGWRPFSVFAADGRPA